MFKNQILTIFFGMLFGCASYAQYPAKPVRIIAASTGTSGDLLARYLGQRLSEKWSQPVIVNGRLYLREQDFILCYDVKAN